MRALVRLGRFRRLLVAGLLLWLFGELAAGPSVFPKALLTVALGAALLVWVVLRRADLRWRLMSVLAALAVLRLAEPALAAALLRALPALAPLAAGLGAFALLGLSAIALAPVAARIGRFLDGFSLRGAWFSEAQAWVPQPRAAVWRALCLAPGCRHWNPRVTRVVQSREAPDRYALILAPSRNGPAALHLDETDREDGVFQEFAIRSDSGFCEGLALIVSVLLEPVGKGTRVLLSVEVADAPLLRFVRWWLDDPLHAYVGTFRRAMARRPKLVAASAPGEPKAA